MRRSVILFFIPLTLALVLFAHDAVLAAPGSVSPVGIVLQAKRANVSSGAAESGATVYDGDSLETAEGGALQVRFGGSQAYLLEQSAALVHQGDAGFGATLTRGTILLSSQNGASFHLLADGATIQPATERTTVAQVTMVSPKELLLRSSKGSLQVTMGDESKTLTEGNSVRMVIQPSESAGGSPKPQPQAAAWSPTITYSQGDVVSYNGVLYASQVNNNLGNTPGRGRGGRFWNKGGKANGAAGPGGQNNFLWLAIGLAAAGVATAVALALITPSDP